MLKRFCSIFLLSIMGNMALASTITFKSLQNNQVDFNGKYTFTKQDGVDRSSDGKIILKKISRLRSNATRPNAYVYDAWDAMTLNGKAYKIHFVSLTENDGSALGVFKIYNTSGKAVDMGNYTWIPDRKPEKTGKL